MPAGLEPRRFVLLSAVLLAVILVLFYITGYIPTQQRLAEARADISVMEGKLAAAADLEQRVDELTGRRDTAGDQLADLSALVPGTLEEPQLLVYLENHALALDLTVWWVGLGPLTAAGPYRMWEIEVKALGPYPRQVELIRALETMGRLTGFQSVSFEMVKVRELTEDDVLLGTYRLQLFVDPGAGERAWEHRFPGAGRDDPFEIRRRQ